MLHRSKIPMYHHNPNAREKEQFSDRTLEGDCFTRPGDKKLYMKLLLLLFSVIGYRKLVGEQAPVVVEEKSKSGIEGRSDGKRIQRSLPTSASPALNHRNFPAAMSK